MAERRRFLLLILTMAVVTLAAVGIGTKLLYDAAFDEERARLIDTAERSAYACLEKPLDIDQLIAIIERIERQKQDGTINKLE